MDTPSLSPFGAAGYFPECILRTWVARQIFRGGKKVAYFSKKKNGGKFEKLKKKLYKNAEK